MDFVLAKFVEFAKLHPIVTTTNVLMSLTFPIDDILIPFLSGRIVSHVQSRKPFKSLLILLIGMMVLMQCVYTMSFWHDAIMFPKLQNFLRNSMLYDIITYYQTNPSISDLRTGEMMSRIVKIPYVTIDFFERLKNNIIPIILSFCVTSAYITYQNRAIGLVMFICGILVAFLIGVSPKSCAMSAGHQEATLAKMDEETEDILRNLPNVYTSGMVPYELKRIEHFGGSYESSFFDTTWCTIRMKILAVMTLTCMLVFFGVYSYRGIMNKTLDIGLYVTIFMVITQWYGTLGWLSSNIRDLVMEWGMLSSHAKMLQQNNNVVDKTAETTSSSSSSSSLSSPVIGNVTTHQHTIIQPIPKRGLYIDNVSYSIPGRNIPILQNINLYVQPNERVAIVGTVGSGKSTLLKIIARLALPTKGDIYIDGIPISAIPLKNLKNKVGYVQQHPMLFNRSIYDNITYGTYLPDQTSRVNELIERLGLHDAFSNLKHGLNTMVGKNGSVLSGGQRQLVQLMRMMLMDPEIVVMDEVTASLDTDTKIKLIKMFDIALKGKTVVMVTHDEYLMKQATRIVNMKDINKQT